MLRILLFMFFGFIVAGCQSTNGVTIGSNPQNSEPTTIMKDTRPRGLGRIDYGPWNQDMPASGWSFNVTNVVEPRSGKLSQRFELRNGDCTVVPPPGASHAADWGCKFDRERAEVQHTAWEPGKNMWIGFSVMVPNEWTPARNNHCTSIFQIKQTERDVYQGDLTPKSGVYATSQKQVDKYGGQYVGAHQVMSGQICGEKFGVTVKYSGYEDTKYNGWSRDENVMYGSINSIRNEWNDVVLNWDTRGYRNGNSKLTIYFNGEPVGVWENMTGKFFPDFYTFKYGPYRGYMKANNGPNFKIGTQVIYFDEVRTGRSFDAVNPATNRALD